MSKNPWLVFYGTLIGQTMKKLCLLHFPPLSFAGTGSTKRTSVCINLEHAPNACLNLAPSGFENSPNYRTVRAPPAPNHLALGHMGPAYDHVQRQKGLTVFQTVPTVQTKIKMRATLQRAYDMVVWHRLKPRAINFKPHANINMHTILQWYKPCKHFIKQILNPRANLIQRLYICYTTAPYITHILYGVARR
jgi:hypothetical protein